MLLKVVSGGEIAMIGLSRSGGVAMMVKLYSLQNDVSGVVQAKVSFGEAGDATTRERSRSFEKIR